MAANVPFRVADPILQRILDYVEKLLYVTIGPFSLATPTVLVSAEDEPWRNCLLTDLVMRLQAAGTTTTTVEVYKNTTLIATLSLASGATRTSAKVSVPLVAGTDAIHVKCTAAGTGASGLVVKGRAK